MNLRRSPVILAVVLASLLLVACTGGTSTESQADAPASVAVEPSLDAEPSADAAESEAAEPSEAAEEEVRVLLEDFAFDPAELTVAVGTRVTFLNSDSAAHTVTHGTDGQAAEDPIIDKELAGNQATSYTFDEPGTYELTCRLHPSMNMTVIVEG